MTPQSTAGDDVLPLADLMQIDEACDRFETAWRSGEPPDPASFLAESAEPARSKLLLELLVLDLEFRRERGEEPDADSYRARFADHPEIIEAVFIPSVPGDRTVGSGQGLARPRPPGGLSINLATEHGEGLVRTELGSDTLKALRGEGYEVLGELGRGGMGVVYLAHKLGLNRRCALKMILAGDHAGAMASARFRAEAETIARLQHPDIVQIYHVGEVSGLPYFELEYLPGGSLDKVLDGTPWPASTAAELIEVLALAIAEAHREGIIHRDLKPANILLSAERRPKVADFGLAKMLDADDGLTKTHTVLGSPSYMAPEQTEGRSRLVGPTTDVYALGAIFYELLTGRPPFRAPTALETLTQVRNDDPVPPSKLQPGLPRAAETICLKCLEKAPSRRYPTAAALAEDLRRFRSGESILAQPARPWELAWRWTRHRPAIAAALGVAGAALILLFLGGLYYNTRLRDTVKKAQAAERAAIEQRNLALSAFDQLVYDVQERLGGTAETRPARQALLKTAIQGLEQIARGTEGSAPNLSRAVAHLKLGAIYWEIGRAAESKRQYDLAHRLAEGLHADSPRDLAVDDCLRRALAGLGGLRLAADHPVEAQSYFQRVVSLAEQIAREEPTRAGARRGQIEAYFQLGRAHAFNGERNEAESWFRKMHDLAENWVAEEPANLLARDYLASSYRKLGDERKLIKDYDGARQAYVKAISLCRAVLATQSDNREFKNHLAITIDDLGGVASTQRQVAEARSLLAEAEQIFTEQVQADPDDSGAQLRLVLTETKYAALERDDLKFTRAIQLYRRALDRLQRLNDAGRLEGRPSFKHYRLQSLQEEIALCESAPAALDALDDLRVRPSPEASRLLLMRIRAMTAQAKVDEALLAASVLCELQPDRAEDLYIQAQCLSATVLLLDDSRWPAPSPQERQILSRRCFDHALESLRLALERGYDDFSRIETDDSLAPLREHPQFPRRAHRIRETPLSSRPPDPNSGEARHLTP